MAPAVFDQTTVDIAATGPVHVPRTGSVLKFAGFTRVYEEGRDDAGRCRGDRGRHERQDGETARAAEDSPTTNASIAKAIEPKQHFTEPPPRFTEASLVRALEENGIGRPSTYSAIVETIQARGYVEQLERRFHPTEIGEQVNDLLAEHFNGHRRPHVHRVDGRRARRVAETGGDWVATAKVLRDVLRARSQNELDEAERKLPKFEQRDEPTDEICPNCGKPMVIKTGPLREVHLVHGLSRVQDDEADPQRHRRANVPRTAAWSSSASRARAARSTAARTIRSATSSRGIASCREPLPGVRRLRRREDEARRRRSRIECHTDETHATGLGGSSDDAEDAELEPVVT